MNEQDKVFHTELALYTRMAKQIHKLVPDATAIEVLAKLVILLGKSQE